MNKFLLGTLALATALTTTAQTQKRAFEVKDVYRVQYASGPTVSAKGQLAYTVSGSILSRQKSFMNIVVDGKTVTNDSLSASPQWSEDGKKLYYTSYKNGTAQLYVLENGISTQLTDYALGVQNAVVSPNGRYVAFAAQVDPLTDGTDGKAQLAALTAKQKNPLQAHLTDSLFLRHWTEYNDGRYWHILVYDLQTKKYTDLTPGRYDSPVFSPNGPSGFVFSPDSKEICYLSNHDRHPEASTNCDLWVVPVTGGETRCLTADNKAWDGSPQYSPDGRWIAYRFQRTPGYESDRFILGLINRKTGEKRVLTEQFDNWVDDFQWSADSKQIYFLGEVRGEEPLYAVDLAKGHIRPVIAGKAISGFCADGKGGFYYSYSTTGKPSALYHADKKGRETQVSHLNDQLEAEVDMRPSETMWVMGAKGDSVEVFIVKPHNFDPSKKYPLIVNVHGGPQMQWMNSFRADWQVYPGAGYVVAYPNPHGSTGYGQAFCRAISGDWGGSPYEDVIAVTNKLAELNYVDSTRMGAMGWSYGGYFMNWLQGQPHRFKCLASMMGVFNLRAMWGTTEELWFPNFELGGQPWNSKLYDKWSPNMYVKNYRTPTLIITGERDYRVSYNQSLEYFTILQTLGIPSRLIVFDNDGHWPSNLKSMPLYYNAHLEWFHKYLGGAPAPWKSEDMVKNGDFFKD